MSGNDDAVVLTILGIFKWDILHLIENSFYDLFMIKHISIYASDLQYLPHLLRSEGLGIKKPVGSR